jgi:hypothetical protein
VTDEELPPAGGVTLHARRQPVTVERANVRGYDLTVTIGAGRLLLDTSTAQRLWLELGRSLDPGPRPILNTCEPPTGDVPGGRY